MRTNKDQRGIIGFTAILVILLVAAVGYAAYTVVTFDDETDYSDQSKVKTKTVQQQSITDSDDITDQLNEIEDIDLEAELDTSELDAALKAF
ncbi:MAG: hypothetical protein AAF413_03690 [Patescibacteria group bacterium]